MKLFEDMTPTEKIDHIEDSLANSKLDVLEVTELADILDVWDYWAPYMINRMRKLEAVVREAKDLDLWGSVGEDPKHGDALMTAISALEAP